MEGDKTRVLIYGNCQGGWLYSEFQRDAALRRTYEFTYLPNFGEIPPGHPVFIPGFVEAAAIVIWQTAVRTPPPNFLSRVSKNAAQIRFPTLWMKPLWPFHTQDPRNQPEPGFEHGPWPYGDVILLGLIKEGVPTSELFERYINYPLAKKLNLTRYTEIAFAELEINDRASDVQVTEQIRENFKSLPLFATVNHPNYFLLERLAFSIRALMRGDSLPQQFPGFENERAVFGDIEIPVHPQIAEHFGLTWVRPDMRWRYNSRLVTLKEWVEAYGAFARIPKGTPPQLPLAQAEQQHRFGNFAEAQRLLIKAAEAFPAMPQFLRYLALLHQQRGLFEDAERVLRVALLRHPQDADISVDLCKLFLRQGIFSEATKFATEVLRANPAHPEAGRLLRAAQVKMTPPAPR